MKFLILLTGCGIGDGTAIEELMSIYITLDKNNVEYTPIAEDKNFRSINHFLDCEEEERNVLYESARIGRGLIKELRDVNYNEYDALIMPGGNGIKKHAFYSEAVLELVNYFIQNKKPIGSMCAVVDYFKDNISNEILSGVNSELRADEYYFDKENNVYYTPAFRKTSNYYEMHIGIEKMIEAIIAKRK